MDLRKIPHVCHKIITSRGGFVFLRSPMLHIKRFSSSQLDQSLRRDSSKYVIRLSYLLKSSAICLSISADSRAMEVSRRSRSCDMTSSDSLRKNLIRLPTSTLSYDGS